jgi:5-methylcytosine-specific restriction endonuclease McrA
MTKADLIHLYGAEWYARQQALNRERAKKRYHEHPELRPTREVAKARQAKWLSKPENLAKHRARMAAHMRLKRAAMTPEERSAYYKAYRKPLTAEQKCKAKARHNAWREANRDHVNERSRAWRAANPEYVRTIGIAMASQRRGAGPVDRELIAYLRSQPCVDCGATERIEVGHVIPVRDGGTNDPANLIPQCRSCNRKLSSKSHRLAESGVTHG